MVEDLLSRPGVERVRFRRGDVLIEQGEKIEYVYYLESGRCYRGAITEGGNEAFFDYKSAYGNFYDAMVGVLSAYSTDCISQCHFVATETICAYRIPKEVVFEYYLEYPDLMHHLLAVSIEKYRQTNWLFAARQEGRVPNQLCKLIYFHSYIDADGRRKVEDAYSSFIRLSQKLGIHKVTVSKMMRALRDVGAVVTEGRKIYIIDDEMVLEYAMNERQLTY